MRWVERLIHCLVSREFETKLLCLILIQQETLQTHCSLTSITRIQSHTYSCTPLIQYICHIYCVCPLSNVLTTNTPGVLYYMKRINILVKSNNKAVIRVYNVFQVFNSCVMNRFFSDALVILLVWVCRKAFSPHHMSMTNRTHFQKSELQK